MISVWTYADCSGLGLPRFTPPRATACVSVGALLRWSARAVWGHCGEATESMSSKSPLSLQLSSWRMNRYATVQLQQATYFCHMSSWCVTKGCPVWQIKRLIGSNQETLGIAERLVAGSLAGAIAQSSIYPMEVRDQWTQTEWSHFIKQELV